MAQLSVERVPTVHVQGGAAIRRPLIVLAVCAVGVVACLARDFLIPTAAAIVLALVVAVPLLILISTVAAHLPSLRWLEVLLSEDRPVGERLAVKPPLASVTPVQVRRRRVATK